MKKQVRILAFVLLAAMLCLGLASCGKKLSGKYEATVLGTGTTLEFSGSKVTITLKALGAELASVEGKYSIKDEKITFEFDSDEEDVKAFNGTFDFEETDTGIKIGALGTFKKAD